MPATGSLHQASKIVRQGSVAQTYASAESIAIGFTTPKCWHQAGQGRPAQTFVCATTWIVKTSGPSTAEMAGCKIVEDPFMVSARIDVHAHFLPDFYHDALVQAGETDPDGFPGIPQWSEEDALKMMDQLQIEAALLSISSPGVHFGDDQKAKELSRRVNEEGTRLRHAHPGRFGLFAVTPLPNIDMAILSCRCRTPLEAPLCGRN